MYSLAALAVTLMGLRQMPAGTQLHIRLTTPVGSYASQPGDPVNGVLIAPVLAPDGEILLPEGSSVLGRVQSVKRVGLGLKHETATLELAFDRLIQPGGAASPLASRVLEVDNSRERVTAEGRILGVRSTASIGYRVSGYIRTVLAWELHAHVALLVAKLALVHVPEPEIYYPAGSELTLALTGPLLSLARPDHREQLTPAEDAQLRQLVAEMPYRTLSRAGRPSDLINVIFLGTRQQIEQAFRAAGWTPPSPATMRARLAGARAVVENLGYSAAPISHQTLDDRPPDMAWQKNLNDIAKRHHVRIWKQPQTWNGSEIWLGAATRDVDYAYLRPDSAGVTHRIEQDIDHERDKIAYDLQFTSCTSLVDWWDRPGAPLSAHNATGDLMTTDGRLAVIRLNDCGSPRLAVASSEPLPEHGRFVQRLVRREILSFRSDSYRANLYWRSYEGTRWMVTAIRRHRRGNAAPPEPSAAHPSSFQRAFNSSWLR